MIEQRQYRRMPWEPLPRIKRWCDTLPDLSRTAFINPVVSVPQDFFFSHICEVLQRLYEKRQRAWRNEHPSIAYNTQKKGNKNVTG